MLDSGHDFLQKSEIATASQCWISGFVACHFPRFFSFYFAVGSLSYWILKTRCLAVLT